MLFKSLTTWFMAAMLLLCPFLDRGECCGRCPEHFAAHQLEQANSPIVASFCQSGCEEHLNQETASSTSESDGPCNHSCPHAEHSDCLCDGAILSSAVPCPEQSVDGWFLADAIESSLIDNLAASLGSASWELGASHFPPLITAREMRVHISSFLL